MAKVMVGNLIQVMMKGHSFKVGYMPDKGQWSATFTCIPETSEGAEWLKLGDNSEDLYYKSRIDLGFAVSLPMVEIDNVDGQSESIDSEIRAEQEDGSVRTEMDTATVQ